MHQFPVNDLPSGDHVKKESKGHVAKKGWPSNESCTCVGVSPVIPTVIRVVAPWSGRFGPPATVKVRGSTVRETLTISEKGLSKAAL
jgi:hypothetical protein